MTLYNGDCLEVMKDISNNSIDLLFCDLPYGQTSCKWDCLIDLDLFWKQVNRICKDDAAMFFTCSTKFGVSLINSNPKNFRYDLIWVKSSPCGFLNAKKMPMKKHEMVYIFYKKLPKVYTENIAEHHTHKFIKETENKRYGKDGVDNKGAYKNRSKTEIQNKYDPPLPTSVIKTDLYSNENLKEPRELYRNKAGQYEPPLPTSVIKDENLCKYDVNKNAYGGGKQGRIKISKDKREHETRYEPPLPTSIIKTEHETLYGCVEIPDFNERNGESRYEPPLPNSILEVKSEKGKHATQKPVELIKWCLKYYSKEGDTVLDPTMGSGSTGVACKEMNRNFIGIEMDEKIYKTALDRLGS